MRKIIGVMLCLSLLMLFTACGDNEDDATTLPQIENNYSETTTIAQDVNVTYVLTTDPDKVIPSVETTQVVITDAETDGSTSSSADGSDDFEFSNSYVTAPEVITSVIATVATATTRDTITSPNSSDDSSSDSSDSSSDTTTTGTTKSLSEYADDLISSLASSVVDEIISTTKATTSTTAASVATTTSSATTTTTSATATTTATATVAQEVELKFSSVYYDGSKYLVLVIDTSYWESNLVFAANSTQIQLFNEDVSQGFVDCIISEGSTLIKIDISSISSSDPMISFSIPGGFIKTTSGSQKNAIFIMNEGNYYSK